MAAYRQPCTKPHAFRVARRYEDAAVGMHYAQDETMLENGFAFAFKESRWSLGYCVWVMYTTGMAKGGRGSPLCLKLFFKGVIYFLCRRFRVVRFGEEDKCVVFLPCCTYKTIPAEEPVDRTGCQGWLLLSQDQ